MAVKGGGVMASYCTFAKYKINTKINAHITTQIESLNFLVCLIINIFKYICEKSELISKHYKRKCALANVL